MSTLQSKLSESSAVPRLVVERMSSRPGSFDRLFDRPRHLNDHLRRRLIAPRQW